MNSGAPSYGTRRYMGETLTVPGVGLVPLVVACERHMGPKTLCPRSCPYSAAGGAPKAQPPRHSRKAHRERQQALKRVYNEEKTPKSPVI